jgi:hypothetical protein
VKPQGRKKVAAPVMIADFLVHSSPFTFLPRNFGSVGEKLPTRGEILVRLSPRISIITPTSAVIIQRKRFEK